MSTPLPIRRTSSLAIVSLVFGVLCWFALPVIGALIAVVCGHMARSEIRQSRGELDGDGMAVAGLVLGWLHLAAAILTVVSAFLFFGGLVWFAHFFHG